MTNVVNQMKLMNPSKRDVHVSTATNDVENKGTMTCSENNTGPCINELLCFIQNRVDTVPLDTLARVCAEFYDSDVIFESKKLLYTKCDVVNRLKKHIGADKALHDVKDIVKVMLEMPLPHAHVFRSHMKWGDL